MSELKIEEEKQTQTLYAVVVVGNLDKSIEFQNNDAISFFMSQKEAEDFMKEDLWEGYELPAVLYRVEPMKRQFRGRRVENVENIKQKK